MNHYAGDKLPKKMRLAAVDLLDACREHLEKNGVIEMSTAEVLGLSTIVLNEVNREVTYGLWEDGEYEKKHLNRG